jgi:hypothetical protein
MKAINMKRRSMTTGIMIAAAALVIVALSSTPAFAGSVALTLVRSTLNNVDDAAGRWQHEGGTIMKGNVEVGQYAIHRRVTWGGTDEQNTAMTTVTLFFSGTGAPPQNVTLQGAHDYSSGRFAGSVSGASNRYNWVHDADALISPTGAAGTSSLYIIWTASNQLTLP